MRSLNLDQLQALVTIVELGSFSAAARTLNLTQPAVSLQLRELEGRVQMRLVERMGKRAYATPAGEELIIYARRIKEDTDQALAAMRRHREGWLGRARLATGRLTCTYLLPVVLRALHEKHPNIDMIISIGSSAQILAAVSANTADLGLVTLPVADRLIDVVPLRSDPLVAVLPPSTTEAPALMTPALMTKHSLILDEQGSRLRRHVDDWFEAAGVLPQVDMTMASVEAIKQVVGAGFGASILPRQAVVEAAARQDLVIRPLDPPLSRQLALIKRHDKPDSPALRFLREGLLTLRTP
jgi:DNA-binding transcriptional LysR family regulator